MSRVATQHAVQERLEVGVGQPLAIYVAVPQPDGTSIVCKGAVYTYAERIRSLHDVTTLARWRECAATEGCLEPWITTVPELELGNP